MKFFCVLKDYLKRAWKQLVCVGAMLLTVIVSMCIANGVQTDFGNVEVTSGSIETTLVDDASHKVSIGFKLYKPKGVDASHKAPAVLCLHGYQNDHETSAAYAMEMARRGAVAVCIDEYGHGSTDAGMIERGYVNHKVTANYGYDEKGVSYLEIGGVTRYKVMMNFSNLSFFKDYYSKSYDFDSNQVEEGAAEVRDSSMGGIAAYKWLADLPYVDNTKMAVTGHSMGTWAAWTVSAFYATNPSIAPAPRATALQCGEIFKTVRDAQGRIAYDSDEDGTPEIYWNNVLLLTAKYDEFNYFRDYIKTPVKEDTIKDEVRTNFLGVSADQAEWNKTYGDFSAGTAVRNEYLVTNHRLTTHDSHAVASIVTWFTDALSMTPTIDAHNQTYMIKEVLVLVCMLVGIASAVAMAMCMKEIPFFAPVFAGVPNRPEKIKKGWKFWRGALITVLISAFTYPFLCQLGHGLMPLPEGFFKMTIGNGFLVWYVFLILVMLGFTIIPWMVAKKKGALTTDYVDLGFARDDEEHKHKFDWALLGKSALVAFIGVFWMYLQVVLCEALFQLDFRFIWPFFKGFSWSRFGQFLAYLPIFAVFFVLNNSRIFAASRVAHTEERGAKAFFSCWWKYAICMVGGILLLCLIEYIPFFLQIGPGADLLFGTTFGGPFMSLLIVFAPQVIVFSFVCTYCYRKTGNAFVGALIVAMLACWIVTGGSAMLYA